MNISNSSLRRQKILDALDRCDSRDSRESLLLDKVIELQDTLFELQQAYSELSLAYRSFRSTVLDQDVYISYNNKE